MGLILDSSVLIAAERKGSNARQALTEIARSAAGEDVALSVVTLIELAHGAARADAPERKAMRRQFLQELTTVPLSQIDDDGHEIIYADGLKNSQLVRDTVTAILANPNTSGYLSGYVGPNAPNLTITSGDLGPPTVQTLPDGSTLITTVRLALHSRRHIASWESRSQSTHPPPWKNTTAGLTSSTTGR